MNMIFWVVVINGLIACLNFYLAWKIWRLRRGLRRAAIALSRVEQQVHNVLYPAPKYIYKGQGGTASLRQRYQKLLHQIERVERILRLIRFIPVVWRWTARRRGS